MSDNNAWDLQHIGASLKLLSGFPFASKDFSTTSGFPLIRIRDIKKSTVETYFKGVFLPAYIIKKGDVLIGMDGDFNLTKWTNQDALLNQRVLKVDILNHQKLDLGFIYYWLQPYIKKINDITAATTVKHLSTRDIQKAEAKIPCVTTQKKIGQILQTIDQTIEKTEALIEKYQQIKAGLMHDLFTRGITADGKLRPPREQAPELYQETPIGWIPKDWGFSDINFFSDIHNNLRLPLSAEVRDGMKGEYAYHGPTGIVDYINEYRANGKYVLIGEDGDHFLKYTRMEMTQLVDGKFNVNNHAHILTGKNGCTTEWLFIYFLHRDITFWLTRQGAGRYKLNKAALKTLPLSCPPLKEQLLIIELIFHQRKMIQQQVNYLKKLALQKQGLMQDLLTGRVPVKVDNEAVHA